MYLAGFICLFIVFIVFARKDRKPVEKLKFLNLAESNAKLFNDLGSDKAESNDNEKAIFYFSKAIELNPQFAEYYLNRGDIYARLKQDTLFLIDWEVAVGYGSKKGIERLQNYEVTSTKSNLLIDKQLDDLGVKYIYHMTHRSNLENIVEFCLLSHTQAHGQSLTKEDISDLEVNDLRKRIHHLVPFYFNPKPDAI